MRVPRTIPVPRALALLAAVALAAAASRCRTAPAKVSSSLDATGVGAALQRITSDPSEETEPTLSPDGSILLFTATVHDAGASASVLVGLDPRQSGAARIGYGPPHGEASDPAWSAQGRWYAYVQKDAGRVMRGPVADPGPHSIVFAADAASPAAPSWSPDGLAVAVSVLSEERHQIVIAAVDGTAVRVVGLGDGPAWSPDGRRIVFGRSQESRHHLYVADASTFAPVTPLTSGEFDDFDPAWSPDGRFIVYSSTRSADQQTAAAGRNLWVMNADGTGATQLTAGTSRAITPSWGNDGWVYFASDTHGDYDIWRVRPLGRFSGLGPVAPAMAAGSASAEPVEAGAPADAGYAD